MPPFSQLLDEHVALLHSGARRTARLRLIIAVFAAAMFGLNFGALAGALWLAGYAGCEIWTQRLYDQLRQRPARPVDRCAALITSVWATAIWMVMALAFWASDKPGLQTGGTVILCALIVHAQCFSVRSRLGLAIIGGVPALSLLVLPVLAGGFTGLELFTSLTCAALALTIMAASARVNIANAHALQAAIATSEAATRAKSDFLASVSHEIRTPLNGVVGVLHLLRAEPISPSAQRLLDEALSCSAMLGQLINDVLDLSKVEAGKLELSYETADPAAILRGVLDLLSPQAEAKRLSLMAEVKEPLGWISTDPVRLRQCLFNLVGNAVKFTREGGVVVRLTRPTAGRLRVEVADTGPGLSSEAQARLFQRFEQAAPSVGREHGGTGLGLAITRTLAELMGGTVGVWSEPGLGSTFWFEIDAEHCEPPATSPVVGCDLQGLRVLIVDDNATNRLVGGKILGSLGATVEVAEGGGEAVQACENADFDLILMDINMPGMDGIEATRVIRQLPGGSARIPIIALTANVMAHQRSDYLAAGMDGVVAKPFSPTSLLEEVLRLAAAPDVTGSDGADQDACAA
jgi:signal transduction histidine kinase